MRSRIMETAINQAQREMGSADIARSINMLLRILQQRGANIRDFDHKDRTLHSIKIYGDKKAFLFFEQDRKEAEHGDQENIPTRTEKNPPAIPRTVL